MWRYFNLASTSTTSVSSWSACHGSPATAILSDYGDDCAPLFVLSTRALSLRSSESDAALASHSHRLLVRHLSPSPSPPRPRRLSVCCYAPTRFNRTASRIVAGGLWHLPPDVPTMRARHRKEGDATAAARCLVHGERFAKAHGGSQQYAAQPSPQLLVVCLVSALHTEPRRLAVLEVCRMRECVREVDVLSCEQRLLEKPSGTR